MPKLITVMTLVDEYVATVNAGFARWSHRKGTAYQACGGHYSRIRGGAHKKAVAGLKKLGYTDEAQIRQIMKDADDLVLLERNATEE
jgi:hypothetical protein